MLEAVRLLLLGDAPVFLLIAGPNGAGKSTFRQKQLDPIGLTCIDPDAVCIELFGHHASTVEQALSATKQATLRVREHFGRRRSVALETVFSDAHGHKLRLIEEAKECGFRTILVFIGVDHPQVSIARVAERLDYGGHDVPDDIIEDRFPRCFENLKKGIGVADTTILIDNTGELRHEVFGRISRNGESAIQDKRPHWFEHFGVDKTVDELLAKHRPPQ